jgi:hypothetical protein
MDVIESVDLDLFLECSHSVPETTWEEPKIPNTMLSQSSGEHGCYEVTCF